MKIRAFAFFCCTVLCNAGCYSPVAYRFHLVRDQPVSAPLPEGVFEDADLTLTFAIDATARRQISMTVTNKTDQKLQVNWRQLTVRDPTGAVVTPRPEVDLGWLAPGATQSAMLSPFSLPGTTQNATSYEGQRFELQVPITIRNEPRSYRTAFIAQVVELAPETP